LARSGRLKYNTFAGPLIHREEEAGIMSVNERVSITACASTTDDAEVVRRTQAAIEQLSDYGRDLRNARKIGVKINAGIHRLVLTDGKLTELTDPAVVEGAIRAIREVTDAEIIVGDAATDGNTEALYSALGHTERLAKYANVRLVDFNQGELVEVPMNHSEAMFRSYRLPRALTECDAFVSLAKMKAHVSLGCTLCIKNLFGWMPTAVYGVPRVYLHDRLIRLPRVLVDLAAWARPCLNVVDGIVAANKSEWNGTPMRPGVIIAGTNCVATDSVGARVMGFDPNGDYPNHPYFYRRNAIKLAADMGLGPNLDGQIEVLGPAPEEIRQAFKVERYDGDTNRGEQIRRGAECVARYREMQDALARKYAGQYLALHDGAVVWNAPDISTMQRLENESGWDWSKVPQFVVRCLPPDEEVEQMDWYPIEARFGREFDPAGA
jgi:uncharacterized protein (DUF362 family)